MIPEHSQFRSSRRPASVRPGSWMLVVLALIWSHPAKSQSHLSGGIPAGLWIGDVTLNQVAQLQRPATPSSTTDPLFFRILVHVAANGDASLLKDATLATITFTNATDGNVVLSRVVVTDPDLPSLRPAASAIGKPLVKRFGTVAYDWDSVPGESKAHQLRMTLAKGPENKARYEARLTNSPVTSTNPFRHPFHAEHLNGIKVTRTMTIRLPPASAIVPAEIDGVSRLFFDYDEEIGGLTKGDTKLRAKGTVSLSRVSEVAVLGLPPPSAP